MSDSMLRTSAGRHVFFSTSALFTRWNDLPYGMWTCADGRQVLFNRFYEPIRQRRPDCYVGPADPKERVEFCRQKWFYSDEHTENQMRALAMDGLLTFLSRGPLTPGTHDERHKLAIAIDKDKRYLTKQRYANRDYIIS